MPMQQKLPSLNCVETLDGLSRALEVGMSRTDNNNINMRVDQ